MPEGLHLSSICTPRCCSRSRTLVSCWPLLWALASGGLLAPLGRTFFVLLGAAALPENGKPTHQCEHAFLALRWQLSAQAVLVAAASGRRDGGVGPWG
jgi:hypothetical protein